MARVLFFGRLREAAGASEMQIEGAVTLGELRVLLAGNDASLAAALNAPGVRVALNQNLLAPGADAMLQESDEVAFMPPVSGG